MAEAALSLAVQKLGDLLIQKLNFLLGVKEQVLWLKQELQMMQSFLKDASKKQVKDERIRTWISDIRSLALDAEDAIESFALKVDAPHRGRGLVGRCVSFPQHVYHLNELGQEIKSIAKRLEDIKARLITYGIQSLDSDPGPSNKKAVVERRRQVFPWHTNKYVVGLEGDVEVLLQKAIFADKNGLSITSIVGMGGSGKSTLAKEVYNNAKTRFECHAWITMTQDFRPRKLMKEILEQLPENKHDEIKVGVNEASEQQLMEMVNRLLKGKQYLVVVDDVWDSDDWQYLEKVFPDDQDRASRLLITSRKNMISRDVYVHGMKALDPDRSWQLFLQASLGNENARKFLPKLEGIGREILEKCNGLPLAIIVVGGLLFDQGMSVSGWENISKRITSSKLACKNSLMSVLELSYEDLPPHLRTCFLCISFFREDYSIYAVDLIQIWIAEGIVPHEEGEQMMEEKAWSYLDELINRNMVQPHKLSIDGRVLHCRIHDLLHDLCIAKAKEEIKFDIIREEGCCSLVKTRHLSVYTNSDKFMSIRCPNPHVRTLFFHSLDHSISGEDVSCSYNHWKSCKGLRVLYLWDVGMQEVSKTIGSMIGLRYLNLARNKISKLPKSLGYLRNLQSLNIVGNEKVKVPNVLWKLDNLRHLMMPLNITCKKPLKLDTLKNLQTLNGVSTHNIVVEHLKELINLQELHALLASDVDVSKFFTSLGTFKNLVKLYLEWSHGRASLDGIVNLKHLIYLSIEGPLAKLPNNFPGSLMHLWLRGTKLENDPMVLLGLLPELLSLKFSGKVYIHEEMTIRDNGFPNLRFFNLDDMPELKLLQIGSDAMPNLIKLVIRMCPEMEILPRKEELRLIANLQDLQITRASRETASKLRSDEYSQVTSKIPSVHISILEPGH